MQSFFSRYSVEECYCPSYGPPSLNAKTLSSEGAYPYRPQSFDFILSFFQCHGPFEAELLFLQLFHLLKPGGGLILLDIDKTTLTPLESAFFKTDQAAFKKAYKRFPLYKNPNTLTSSLLSAGFHLPLVDTTRLPLAFSDKRALLKNLQKYSCLLSLEGGFKGLLTPAYQNLLESALPPKWHLKLSLNLLWASAWRQT